MFEIGNFEIYKKFSIINFLYSKQNICNNIQGVMNMINDDLKYNLYHIYFPYEFNEIERIIDGYNIEPLLYINERN